MLVESTGTDRFKPPGDLDGVFSVQKSTPREWDGHVPNQAHIRPCRKRRNCRIVMRQVASVCFSNKNNTEWNKALRAHRDAQHDYQRQRDHGDELNARQREKIKRLASDFPQLWNNPQTTPRDRKRMVRLLIDDVTLTSHDDATITLGIRLRGGAVQTLRIARELPACEKYRTPASVVADIDSLLEEHTESEIAEILNRRGTRSGHGRAFNVRMVAKIRQQYRLKPRLERLRERGLLTVTEAAQTLGVCVSTIKQRRRDGLIRGCRINDRYEYLVELPMVGPVL